MNIFHVHIFVGYTQRKNTIRSVFHLVCIMIGVGMLWLVPVMHVSAAVISFDPQETTVGLEDSFLIGVNIDADVPVNTVNVVIDIPDSMEISEISDGDSVINMWIERPHITDAHTLVFSGIIPGGFEGVGGKLLTLTVRAKQEGTYDFLISPNSSMYENVPEVSRQVIISQPLSLSVVRGKVNLSNPIPDTVPPELFVPVIVTIPDGKEGYWAVSFQTQDKVSGVAYYEVAESTRNITTGSGKKIERLPWNRAIAPYTLTDQQRSSYVYVKAVDLKGNVRYVKINPAHPRWQGSIQRYILIMLSLFIALHVIFTRIRITRIP